MATTTRQKLVDAATKRFYRDGFRNVGIDQILMDVGISKTAFYKHFECKEDLMLEALIDHDRLMQETFCEMAKQRGGSDLVAQLRALFDVVETIISDPTFQGCIFVNAAIEFPLPHEPAHLAAARSKQAMEDVVTEFAAAAGQHYASASLDNCRALLHKDLRHDCTLTDLDMSEYCRHKVIRSKARSFVMLADA